MFSPSNLKLWSMGEADLDAFMHNWANPPESKNELSVPSESNYA